MWIGNTQCRDNILAATHRVDSLRARRVRPSHHGSICGPQRHEYLKVYLGKFLTCPQWHATYQPSTTSLSIFSPRVLTAPGKAQPWVLTAPGKAQRVLTAPGKAQPRVLPAPGKARRVLKNRLFSRSIFLLLVREGETTWGTTGTSWFSPLGGQKQLWGVGLQGKRLAEGGGGGNSCGC